MSSKADRLSFWMDRTDLRADEIMKQNEYDGKPLTFEDRMILNNLSNVMSGKNTYAAFKAVMELRYGISASGSGAELSGTAEDKIDVGFGTRIPLPDE